MRALALALLTFCYFNWTVTAAKAPPPGINISKSDRQTLDEGTKRLERAIADLKGRPYLEDVIIFYNAVRYALDDNMFYKPEDLNNSKNLINLGLERARQLAQGKHPWTSANGLIVRGYRSGLDDSVIPYGIDVPKGFNPKLHRRWRMDVWLHGRNNTLSEVRFLSERLTKPSPFRPKDTIVLHPYGRYCNAYKFAGEVDVLESLQHARMQYRADPYRISMRGFSMGGAGAWHLGAHHAGEWAAVAPGAGFVDTAVYQNIFAKDPKPTWWEQKLWLLYDVPPIAANFVNTTTVAYSGSLDKQKQAADLMAKAFEKEQIKLTHIIGPKTGHKYEPNAKLELAKQINAAVTRGANAYARRVTLVTYTLKYNRMKWVSIHGLKRHWSQARVDAEYLGDYHFRVKTQNVTKLMLSKLEVPNQGTTRYTVTLDGQKLQVTPERHAPMLFWNQDGKWQAVVSLAQNNLAKTPGLQGPIDDAFLSPFTFVRPTGKPMNKAIGQWVKQEMTTAQTEWHRQFRGNVRIKDDIDIDDRDHFTNLILWGDPQSNAVIAKIADQLPIEWTPKGIRIKDQSWPADRFVPVLIYPNPNNLRRYIVFNSGFTFSQYGYMSNSMQNAKLPDYAVLDLSVPIAERIPKGVAHAGFFGENWELTDAEGKD